MTSLEIIKKFSIHLLVFFLIIILIASISVVIRIFGPTQYLYSDDSWSQSVPYIPETNITFDILLDQHSHTKYSDGKLTVKQNIEWHIAMGFTAVVISDHNTLKNSEEIERLSIEYKNDIIVLQGMEWTTRRVHLNLIGISEWNHKIPLNPSDEDIQEAIKEVHKQNGIVTLNHPGYTELNSGDRMPERTELLDWGVDYLEVINGLDFDETSYSIFQNSNYTFGLITGTDMHSPISEDGGRVFAWTAINTSVFSKESLMEQLRKFKTEIILNNEGIENQGNYQKSFFGSLLVPFYRLGEAIIHFNYRNENSHDASDRIIITVFVSYSLLIFSIFEFLSILRRKLKPKLKTYTKKKTTDIFNALDNH